MFQLEVLRNQWVLLALFGGAALALMLVLYYLAAWRPRPQPDAKTPSPENRGPGNWLVFTFPWILIVLYVSLAAFGLIYLIMRVSNPPNW